MRRKKKNCLEWAFSSPHPHPPPNPPFVSHHRLCMIWHGRYFKTFMLMTPMLINLCGSNHDKSCHPFTTKWDHQETSTKHRYSFRRLSRKPIWAICKKKKQIQTFHAISQEFIAAEVLKLYGLAKDTNQRTDWQKMLKFGKKKRDRVDHILVGHENVCFTRQLHHAVDHYDDHFRAACPQPGISRSQQFALFVSLRFKNSTKRRLSGWTMTRMNCLSKCSSLTVSLIPCLRTQSMCSHLSMTRGPKETRSPQSFPDKIVFLRPPSELDCSRCSFFHQLTCQQQPLDAFGPNITSLQAK